MNIDIANYPEFREEAMTLKKNLGIMLGKMDGLVASNNFTVDAKAARMSKLVDEYLP